MTTCSRRQFFFGHWTKNDSRDARAEGESHEASETTIRKSLPSDFSPAMLKMQGRLMGLDVEHLTPEELSEIIADALYATRPAEETETTA